MTNNEIITLACGSKARMDNESTFYAFRCLTCFCVVGSAGMPPECREIMETDDSETGEYDYL